MTRDILHLFRSSAHISNKIFYLGQPVTNATNSASFANRGGGGGFASVTIGKSTFVWQKSVSAVNLHLIQAKKHRSQRLPAEHVDILLSTCTKRSNIIKQNYDPLQSLVHNPTQLALFMYTHSSYQGV